MQGVGATSNIILLYNGAVESCPSGPSPRCLCQPSPENVMNAHLTCRQNQSPPVSAASANTAVAMVPTNSSSETLTMRAGDPTALGGGGVSNADRHQSCDPFAGTALRLFTVGQKILAAHREGGPTGPSAGQNNRHAPRLDGQCAEFGEYACVKQFMQT